MEELEEVQAWMQGEGTMAHMEITEEEELELVVDSLAWTKEEWEAEQEATREEEEASEALEEWVGTTAEAMNSHTGDTE